MNAIITLPLVPLRENDNERSELYTQLLFGECVEILETRERWLFVRNHNDNYKGWLDKKMVQVLSSDEEAQIEKTTKKTVQVPIMPIQKANTTENMFLPGGSVIHSEKPGECIIGNETYLLNSTELDNNGKISGQKLIQSAHQYLNAPYLWGGKSIMGIDCSGLVQVVFFMNGIQLDRDASAQVDSGQTIDFLSESKAGDLAFFENPEGRIIHVGMLLNSHQIIHASGWVKVETIDSNGIISAQSGEYTHKLRIIKRLI